MTRVLYIWAGQAPHRATEGWESEGARALAEFVAERVASNGVVPARDGYVIAAHVTAVTEGVDRI